MTDFEVQHADALERRCADLTEAYDAQAEELRLVRNYLTAYRSTLAELGRLILDDDDVDGAADVLRACLPDRDDPQQDDAEVHAGEDDETEEESVSEEPGA